MVDVTCRGRSYPQLPMLTINEKSGSVSSKSTRLKLELLRPFSSKSNFVYLLIKTIWPILTVVNEVIFSDESLNMTNRSTIFPLLVYSILSVGTNQKRVPYIRKTSTRNKQKSTKRIELKSGKLWQAQIRESLNPLTLVGNDFPNF